MKKVLIIEPDKVLAATYARAFRYAGYEVSCAHSAQAAIHAADSSTPDIIVLELQLNHHDGIEFLHELRSYAEWRELPVIVNTFLSPQRLELVMAGLENSLGVRAFLYKPQTSLQQLIGKATELTQ